MVCGQRAGSRVSRSPDKILRLRVGVSGDAYAGHEPTTFCFRRLHRKRSWLVYRTAGLSRSSRPRTGRRTLGRTRREQAEGPAQPRTHGFTLCSSGQLGISPTGSSDCDGLCAEWLPRAASLDTPRVRAPFRRSQRATGGESAGHTGAKDLYRTIDGVFRRSRPSGWGSESRCEPRLGLRSHYEHFRHSAARWISLRADHHQRLWKTLWRGLQFCGWNYRAR